MQTVHLNYIENKSYMTKNMLWKCIVCLFTFLFNFCSDKEYAELFDFDNSNFFYVANYLNNLFKNLFTVHIMNIQEQIKILAMVKNFFFQNVNYQYSSASKNANFLLFNSLNVLENFSKTLKECFRKGFRTW